LHIGKDFPEFLGFAGSYVGIVGMLDSASSSLPADFNAKPYKSHSLGSDLSDSRAWAQHSSSFSYMASMWYANDIPVQTLMFLPLLSASSCSARSNACNAERTRARFISSGSSARWRAARRSAKPKLTHAPALTGLFRYDQWLTNHILPRWGDGSITDVQPRPVELWLHSLTLSPKSRVHIRGVLHQLWEFAMWRGDVPAERNPMTLVTVRGATKRTNAPRSLTFEEFQKFVSELPEPFRTMALLCLCLGLRISECLALKWADIDWLASKISVERAIVRQRVDDVKTAGSRKHLRIDGSLLEVLKTWKQTTQFSAPGDWVFAPTRLGRLPWSYPRVWGAFQKAAEVSKVGKLATHTMRHSYRSWLDAVGTPVAVQQKLMRHADIRTTMNIYGDW